MTVYVSPIGYDSTRVSRPILREGIDEGDHICLLHPKRGDEDTRAAEAIDDVERMLKQLQPEVTVTTQVVQSDDFRSAVLECSSIITSIDETLVINFGGGPREIYLPLATATLAHPDCINKALQFRDLDGDVVEIPLPRITGGLSEPTIDTLNTILQSESGVAIPELAAELDRAKSTVSRHVQQLEEFGAVKSEMHGKAKYVQATFTGELRSRMVSD